MKFKRAYFIGICIGLLILLVDYLYFFGEGSIGNGRFFYALIVLGISVGWSQFWIDFFKEGKRQKEIEEKFIEFVRAIVSSVKSGIPVTTSVIRLSGKDFGALTPHVTKLANQIRWGIPIQEALLNFGKDTKNDMIKRALSIVIEAEQSGGAIEEVLYSITDSMVNVKKIKAERKARAHAQVIQGYIVFFVFIAIMLVLQLGLFPRLGQLTGGDVQQIQTVAAGMVGQGEGANLDKIFFSLVIIQGFFAGIAIGRFSEGTLRQGILHSLALITAGSLIVSIFNPAVFSF